jgi:ubiquitin carboxyl-terminal hydrolase 7
MIFLKWFDCSRQTLLGQGKVFVNKNSKISELQSHIQEKMGWPSSTPIKLFEVRADRSYSRRVLIVW